tara:strand:+ start:357 stop:1460 length:1104 start_codon:yes stop_codon:yes gene_type:complete
MKKILFVFGTRPEAIKLALLIKELKKNFIVKVCITTQHKKMLTQVLKVFKIKVDFDLNCMKPNQTLNGISSLILSKIHHVYKAFNPDLTIVQGDTISAFIGAYSSFLNNIKVAHVEAGLRTLNLKEPFPEEGLRQLISKIAYFHFAPTNKNKQSLIKEGIKKNIYVTGNTSIDTVLKTKNIVKRLFFKKNIKNIFDKEKNIILVTLHRREIYGYQLTSIAKSLVEISKENKNISIIIPIHLNPNIRRIMIPILSNIKNIHLLEPLDYFQFVKLMSYSKIIITDSGGIQEEAPSLNIPVLVCRKKTERMEAVKSGSNVLVGSNSKKLRFLVKKLLSDKKFYLSMTNIINPYGDGRSVKNIYKILEKKL